MTNTPTGVIMRFQSHAGSIEAFIVPPLGSLCPSFQSHAGSIEAMIATIFAIRIIICFNPTLVRLRLGHLALLRKG